MIDRSSSESSPSARAALIASWTSGRKVAAAGAVSPVVPGKGGGTTGVAEAPGSGGGRTDEPAAAAVITPRPVGALPLPVGTGPPLTPDEGAVLFCIDSS